MFFWEVLVNLVFGEVETGKGGGYSRDALPKTVDTPRMRIAGW